MLVVDLVIDWCPNCAIAGCDLAHQKSFSKKAFAYIFVRICKAIPNICTDIIECYIDEDFSIDKESQQLCSNNIKIIIPREFYEDYFKDSVLEKEWFRKSNWKFMKHFIEENLIDVAPYKPVSIKNYKKMDIDIYATGELILKFHN